MGGRGASSGFNIDTSGLNGHQKDILDYYMEHGEFPPYASSYQRQKLTDLINQSKGLPKAESYKGNDLDRASTEKKFREDYDSVKHTPAEEKAKDNYMMYSDDMNAFLRGGEYSESHQSDINTIKKSMKVNNSSDNLYRGVDGATLGIKPTDLVSDIRSKLVGKTHRDKGIMSTSKSRDVAKEWSNSGANGNYSASVRVVMVINPKGTKTTMINSGLSEVLIHPNTKLQYTDVKKKGDIVYVYARKP